MYIALIILLSVLLLVISTAVGVFIGFLIWGRVKAKPIIPEAPSDAERASIAEQRRSLIEEQNAFQNLLGYNADIAYGVSADSFPKEAN